MPWIAQQLTLALPNTHFVALSQAILFRGAGIGEVWPQFLALVGQQRYHRSGRSGWPKRKKHRYAKFETDLAYARREESPTRSATPPSL
jgi:hypothetical protein